MKRLTLLISGILMAFFLTACTDNAQKKAEREAQAIVEQSQAEEDANQTSGTEQIPPTIQSQPVEQPASPDHTQ